MLCRAEPTLQLQQRDEKADSLHISAVATKALKVYGTVRFTALLDWALQTLQARARCSTCTQGFRELMHRLIAGWHFWRRKDNGRSGVWSPDKACNEGGRLPAMLLRLDCQRCSSPGQPIGLVPCNPPASTRSLWLSCRL